MIDVGMRALTCSTLSSPKWGAAVDSRALRPVLHTPTSSFSRFTPQFLQLKHAGKAVGLQVYRVALHLGKQLMKGKHARKSQLVQAQQPIRPF